MPSGTGHRHRVDVNGRHQIVTDEPASLGGTNEGPAPHELVPAALASCVSTMVSMYAKRHGWRSDVSVEVSYEPEAEPPKIDVALILPPGLDEVQVKRLEHVAEHCPVRRALEAGFAIRETTTTAPGEIEEAAVEVGGEVEAA